MTQAANLAALGTNASSTGILPAAGGGTAGTAGVSGFKNRLINGAMQISQRYGTSAVTLDNTDQYTLDRWAGRENTDGTATIIQSSTAPSGYINSLLFTVTSADSSLAATQFARILQRIEGLNVSDLAWGTSSAKTITLSFWVRCSVTGTFGGSIENSAADRSYPFTYTISSADTWEQKTITIAGDTTGTWLTTNGIGLQVQLSLGAGSSLSGTANTWATADYLNATGATNLMATNGATFYLTGFQLEVGSAATNFDVRSYQQELAMCQRYYYAPYNYYTSPGANNNQVGTLISLATTTVAYCSVNMPAPMRASPTVTFSSSGWGYNWAGSGSGNVTSLAGVVPQFSPVNPSQITLQFNLSGGVAALATPFLYITSASSSTTFNLSAEL